MKDLIAARDIALMELRMLTGPLSYREQRTYELALYTVYPLDTPEEGAEQQAS